MVFGLQKLQNDLFCVTEERNYFQSKYLEQVNEIAALKDELRKAKREIGKLRGEILESSISEGLDESLGGYSSYSTPSKHRRRSRHSTGSASAGATSATGSGGSHGSNASPAMDGNGIVASPFQEEKKENDDDNDQIQQSKLKNDKETEDHPHDEHDDDDEEEDDDDDEDAQAADIRQSAEKLLQWASYRSYQRSSSATGSSPDHGSVGSPAAVNNGEDSLLGPMIPRTIESASLDDRSTGNLSHTLSQDSASATTPATPAVVQQS